MKTIVYPYNEILPKKKAHDIFIMHECAALAELGWHVTVLVGKGSEKNNLHDYYRIPKNDHLRITPLFILRKNPPLHIGWNRPFFFLCQRQLRKLKPDYVLLSVRKQAAFHLMNKIPGVRYVYEVHELCYYPNQPVMHSPAIQAEKNMLEKADLITVTTAALKEILQNPPYSLNVPIAVVPLAVKASPLPVSPDPTDPLVVAYVGQLYEGQGIPCLLEAMKHTQGIHLKIIGGTPSEIAHFKKLAPRCVEFVDFVPPSQLNATVQQAHAFVAPFENTGRMPYVAHTKLFEYAEWGRPMIAPKLPIVEEHFKAEQGVLFFEPDNHLSLANTLSALKESTVRQKAQAQISMLSGRYNWQTRALTYQKLLN